MYVGEERKRKRRGREGGISRGWALYTILLWLHAQVIPRLVANYTVVLACAAVYGALMHSGTCIGTTNISGSGSRTALQGVWEEKKGVWHRWGNLPQSLLRMYCTPYSVIDNNTSNTTPYYYPTCGLP